jgi:hypothetical protein
MDASQRAQILQNLADGIARRRLTTPARIVLEALAPLGFLASQVTLFVRPFTPLGRWQAYISALDDEEGWEVLRELVDKRDC